MCHAGLGAGTGGAATRADGGAGAGCGCDGSHRRGRASPVVVAQGTDPAWCMRPGVLADGPRVREAARGLDATPVPAPEVRTTPATTPEPTGLLGDGPSGGAPANAAVADPA